VLGISSWSQIVAATREGCGLHRDDGKEERTSKTEEVEGKKKLLAPYISTGSEARCQPQKKERYQRSNQDEKRFRKLQVAKQGGGLPHMWCPTVISIPIGPVRMSDALEDLAKKTTK